MKKGCLLYTSREAGFFLGSASDDALNTNRRTASKKRRLKEMELIKPDYRGGILGVINAWRKELGLSVHHPADPQVSAWLAEHQWHQIVVLLIDGMGSRLLETKLEKDSFLRTHQLKEVTTVYPSTTSAATTSVLSGKSPAENGWIGWHQYFKELDDSLILFMNRSYYGERSYPEYSYTCLLYTARCV